MIKGPLDNYCTWSLTSDKSDDTCSCVKKSAWAYRGCKWSRFFTVINYASVIPFSPPHLPQQTPRKNSSSPYWGRCFSRRMPLPTGDGTYTPRFLYDDWGGMMRPFTKCFLGGDWPCPLIKRFPWSPARVVGGLGKSLVMYLLPSRD